MAPKPGRTGAEWESEARREALAQWTHDPAGARDAAGADLGTAEAFAAIERARYREQRWMHETFDYARFCDARVLEIGVGLGTDHVQFARAGARLNGIDLAPRSIEMTRARLEQEGLTSDLQTMDAENLEFEDGIFDAVYSFGVLHHVPSPERAFREVRRVLRPGGVFLGGLYNRDSLATARMAAAWAVRLGFRRERFEQRLSRSVEFSTGEARPLVRLFTARELRSLLHEAGFSDVTVQKRHAGLGRYSSRVPRRLEAALGAVGGWYLVHEAR